MSESDKTVLFNRDTVRSVVFASSLLVALKRDGDAIRMQAWRCTELL